MAATQGTAIFAGLRSRKSYIVDIYLDDVADERKLIAANLRWLMRDKGGCAYVSVTGGLPL